MYLVQTFVALCIWTYNIHLMRKTASFFEQKPATFWNITARIGAFFVCTHELTHTYSILWKRPLISSKPSKRCVSAFAVFVVRCCLGNCVCDTQSLSGSRFQPIRLSICMEICAKPSLLFWLDADKSLMYRKQKPRKPRHSQNAQQGR